MLVELRKSFTNYGPNKRRSCNWIVSHLRITEFYAKQTAPQYFFLYLAQNCEILVEHVAIQTHITHVLPKFVGKEIKRNGEEKDGIS